MFPWNIAKSAEAMFSRWAIKRVCKFLLKKKLGQLILGDIDLNQLDVQLTAGTIQLSDLALNVDYLNQKFGAAAAVVVKEGSIGSLLVTMPWKGKGCQIEVDELELVLAPCGVNVSHVGSETCVSSQDGNCHTSHDLGKLEHEIVGNTVTNALMDVHEGVKTIAKMVKWLLTSFNVKIRKLIVAFDPSLGEEKNKGLCRTLVLRITEAECGTCISEDINSNDNVTVDNFLGLSRMTNFIKFQGAILEFLHMDVDNQTQVPCASGTTFGEWFSGCSPLDATTPILTGKSGGFSGNLKLSIPWKNGSLDIRKVDANAYIDPLELRFQPSSIKYFLYLWDIYKDMGKNSNNEVESVYFSTASQCHSSTTDPCMLASSQVLSNNGSFPAEFSYAMAKETVADALLPGSHLISDWVTSSTSGNQKDRTEGEPDFGASIDQFFECFDGLRNTQSALGSSGMWNWTCSVFSAMTAVSNLASGSLHVPSEQQHVETNLKATVAGISFLFSFVDEDQMHPCDLNSEHTHAGSSVHYMGVKFQDMVLVLQVRSQEMNFEAKVEHIELTDHFNKGNGAMDFGLHGCEDNIRNQVVSIQQMQAAVQDSLPSFFLFNKDADLEKSSQSVDRDAPCAMHSTFRCIHTTNFRSLYRDDVVKVTLLRTSGVSHFQFTVNSGSSSDSFKRPSSFSLKLPPFVFWVNFHLVSMVSDFLKELGQSFETSEAFNGNLRPLSQDVGRSSGHYMTLSPKERLRGNIFLPNARIILCFPFEKDGDFRSYTSWDQFIALDFSSPSILGEGKVQAPKRDHIANSKKRYPLATSCSMHLNVGNLDIYLITLASKDNVKSDSYGMQKLKFFAQNILSVTDGAGRLSVISMLWQEGPVTGPWVAKKAKILATGDSRSRNESMAKGYEFASVTTVKDMEDFNAHTQREIILSSAFFLHAHLSHASVNLDSSQYKNLNYLLQQLLDWLSCLDSDPVGTGKESCVSQTSTLVECDSVEISVSLEAVESIKGSIQNELPGSWYGFKLQIQNFELISVSNIGEIRDSSFLWVVHGEGSLWGTITGVPNEELLLISCNNSTMGRGGGEGSNVLSSRFSGSDIVHLWDSQNFQSHTSITVRCGTVVAIGGRLDWLDSISSFFSLPSPEIEQAANNSLQKGDPEICVAHESSFVLKLVDFGLTYEPYLNNLAIAEGSASKSSSANVNEKMGDECVGCLLAASSLKLSSAAVADSINRDYTIRLQDLGLLICAVSRAKHVSGIYSVEHLRKIGYVKVAQEAHVEALLRMNCDNGCLWEVECPESHILLDTCHDTASGLIRLAAQLQQLFAPDMEESLVHLQTRWNNVQQAHMNDETRIFNSDSVPSTSQMHSFGVDTRSKPGLGNLMDEICEDAFLLDGYLDGQSDSCESDVHISPTESFLGKTCDMNVRDPESLSHDMPSTEIVPVIGLENGKTSFSKKSFPEFIEGYFLSGLRPLMELSLNNQSSSETLKCKTSKKGEVRRGSGWYGDSTLRILEDHVSDVIERSGPEQLLEGDNSNNHTKPDEHRIVKGRVLLKNINVLWRMYAGSDWHNSQTNDHHSAIIRGRDTSVCLEFALSGVDFQYDIFPDGEICVSRLLLSVEDFCLNDNSNDAPWKLVLGYYESKDHPRQSSSKAFKLDLEAVRPDPSTPLEEYRLRIAFLPMRLHLHQSQLDFLISFFGGRNSSVDQYPSAPQDSGELGTLLKKSSNLGGCTIIEEALLPYFQKFDIWPVLVRVDYSPCRFDLAALRGGKYVELVNLVPWKGVELQLKHVQAVGVYGWSCVCETIIGEWLEDISQNQIRKLLKGLPPIRSLVAVGSGAAKLVSLPVKNYKKDHRLLKGMQRGTIAFLRSISLEAVGLGVHLAAGAHDVLLQAEYILTSIPSSVPWPVQSRVNTNVRSNQPKDARQGIQQAYESISDGLGKTASALVQTPLKRYQRGAGVGSALATAVQAAPAAAIAPASATARAVHCALLGVRNSLDPEHKKESMDKYLGTTQPQEFI